MSFTRGLLTELSRRQSARMGEDGAMQPEPLADIALRARYAGEWMRNRADRLHADADSVVFNPTEFGRGYELGEAWGREDAARTLLTIADALDAVLGVTFKEAE